MRYEQVSDVYCLELLMMVFPIEQGLGVDSLPIRALDDLGDWASRYRIQDLFQSNSSESTRSRARIEETISHAEMAYRSKGILIE